MNFVSSHPTPDDIRIQYEKALADFVEAHRAALAPYPADMDGMSATHDAAKRFEAARANRTMWAHRVASL